jgi:hypothetical protein
MAIIVGQTTRETFQEILSAGYDVASEEAVLNLLRTMDDSEVSVAVWVDCNVEDLLALQPQSFWTTED